MARSRTTWRLRWCWLACGLLVLGACSLPDDLDPVTAQKRRMASEKAAAMEAEPPASTSPTRPPAQNDKATAPTTGTTGRTRGGQPLGRPSGARVRVVNAYVPLDDAPGPIEVYSHAWASEGDKPLMRVPYGGVSEFFDPTVYDDDGNTFIAIYWPGTQGDGNALISATETLHEGDVVTYVLTTGSSEQESGRRFGAMRTFFHGQLADSLPGDADPEGKAILVVDSTGMDQVLSSPEESSFFFSVGDGCAKAAGDSDFSLTAIGPGTSGTYLLDPGSYSGSIHEHARDDSDVPSCDDDPVLEDLEIDAAPDEEALLLFYASEDREFDALFVPLERD